MSERFIALLDMDSFFASTEQQWNPRLRGRPMGVVRKPWLPSVISAPSREAKRLGVKTGMITSEALAICPSLRIILENPDRYMFTSERVFKVMYEFSPKVEVFSIDEAWIDMTQITHEHFGGNPRRTAGAIKKRVREVVGPFNTCSVGIGPSKVVAKIAAEIDKPNGVVWVKQNEVPTWFDTLDVTKACGINKRIKRRLLKYGIETLGDLGRCPPYRLRHEFGIVGHYLWTIGNGMDVAPLSNKLLKTPLKGYGHSRVLRHPWPMFCEVQETLQTLCYMVARRMRGGGKSGRVVHFHAAGDDGLSASKQRALGTPTNNERMIYLTCLQIAKELEDQGRLPHFLDFIGVQVTKLYSTESLTIPLFPKDRQRQRILGFMDEINDIWGEFSVHWGARSANKLKVMEQAANRGDYRRIKLE